MAAREEPSWASALVWHNKTLNALPVDESMDMDVRSRVRGACFSFVEPSPLLNPDVVCISWEAAEQALGGEAAAGLRAAVEGDSVDEKRRAAAILCGNEIAKGARPAAHCYCGHQFGYFSGQLGDGATMYLGELGANGRGESWEIQYKGAGKTPYSRSADGRKVLRSSIREFLMSENMEALGVPTTRALSVVTSDTFISRDQFYDGRAKQERATVIVRAAQTFLRFGSFEIFRGRDEHTGREGPSHGLEEKMLPLMLDFVSTYFPEISLAGESHADKEDLYVAVFRCIVERTAKLCAHWQCIGWCHGVLNTDNMSIVGLTLDYGPFGFMERFDPNYICNASDDSGRYSYKQQPKVCKWNCRKLMECWALAMRSSASIARMEEAVATEYDSVFEAEYLQLMRRKLGLMTAGDEDAELIKSLFATMETSGADFTETFLAVSRAIDGDGTFESFFQLIEPALASAQDILDAVRPSIHPHQLRTLIDIAEHQPEMLRMLTGVSIGTINSEIQKLQRAHDLRDLTPESKRGADREAWMGWFTHYRARISRELAFDQEAGRRPEDSAESRREMMRKANPKNILRNHVAQRVIDRAEAGDYSDCRNVLEMLRHPYDDPADVTVGAQGPPTVPHGASYFGPAPKGAPAIIVT